MNRMAARLLERVFVKVHIRAAWNKLHNITEQGELSSALESLIHLTATDSSYCELIGVMVDMISTDSLGIAAPFLCHIIDMAALPSQQTTRRMSQQLLSKCDPGGLARLRSKKKNKPAAALIWSVLANRLAGEMSSILFSDAVCGCLLNNIENDPDMLCKVFSIIALEKFSLTGLCKARIMRTPIRRLLRDTANMSTFGLTDQEEIAGIMQAKFCAEWSLRNIFRDNTLEPTEPQSDASPRDSDPRTEETKRPAGPKTANINVMLNTLDATRHWKVSEDGLSIRNDGSTFESIRATKSVTCGKWYYEVSLVTVGIMQIGWATAHCQFSPEDGTGIGDDMYGFAYDGCRNMIWADGDSEPYGDSEPWRPGDVLGFYLDIDNAVMECFINGRGLGPISPLSKEHLEIQAVAGYYPALSFTSFQQATINFGATPFRYPPALPWRNLNDNATISAEMRMAIVRPRSDSIHGRIVLDPVTGVRLPAMAEEESEIDYSLLCTICCDHTATVTLQPCGHNGLCIQCAYSLDMCPLCRSRIYQRQMLSTTNVASHDAMSGLGISGLAQESNNNGLGNNAVSSSGLGMSSSSSATISVWSTEYFGPSGSNSSSITGSINSNLRGAGGSTGSSNDRGVPPLATMRRHESVSLDHPPHHPMTTPESNTISVETATAVATVAATLSGPLMAGGLNSTRRRNTLAGSSPLTSRPVSTLLLDPLDDNPFSPPSTAYFTFLNRPPRSASATTTGSNLGPRSQIHPLDMEPNIDPLEMVTQRSRLSNSSRISSNQLQETIEENVASEEMEGEEEETCETDPGTMTVPPNSGNVSNEEPRLVMEQEQQQQQQQQQHAHDIGDLEGNSASQTEDEMDVDLVDEGREATSSEVMEQSAPDFPEGHSIHSRRNSIQVASVPLPLPLPLSNSVLAEMPTHMGSIPSMNSIHSNTSVGSAGSVLTGPVTGSVGTRFGGGRRASMPSNRLEM